MKRLSQPAVAESKGDVFDFIVAHMQRGCIAGADALSMGQATACGSTLQQALHHILLEQNLSQDQVCGLAHVTVHAQHCGTPSLIQPRDIVKLAGANLIDHLLHFKLRT